MAAENYLNEPSMEISKNRYLLFGLDKTLKSGHDIVTRQDHIKIHIWVLVESLIFCPIASLL